MPTDRKAQAVRREAILEILDSGVEIEQQSELVDMLKARGIPSTQSSISRDLRELGAVRVKGHYEIPDWNEDESPFQKVIPFIKRVKPCGPYQMLLVTDEGAGSVVAQAIDSSGWDDVLGTVAGYHSVLILTDGAFDQKLVYLRLRRYLLGEEDEGVAVMEK